MERLMFVLFPDERIAISLQMEEMGRALQLLPVRSRRKASKEWVDVGRWRYFTQQQVERKLWHWQAMLRLARDAPDPSAKAEWVTLAYLRLGGMASNKALKSWCTSFGVDISDANIMQTRDGVHGPRFQRDDEIRPVEIGDWKRWELCLPNLQTYEIEMMATKKPTI